MNAKSGHTNGEQHKVPKRTPCAQNTILLVDDEQPVREIFARVVALYLPHCKVDLAANGAEAVSRFRDVRHAIIVMDVCMPVMDGEAAFRAIHALCEAENQEMPSVIFCTGFGPSHDIQNAVAANPIHCILRKPLNPTELTDAIQSRLTT